MSIEYRTYGSSGPWAILLHGGPGAAGYLAPVARELAGSFRVIEPFQRRGSAEKPVTIVDHIENLRELIAAQCGQERPALAGHSWGAMLGLCYAARYTDTVCGVVLVGNGTFDPASRQRLEEIRKERMGPEMRRRISELPRTVADPDKRLALLGKWMKQIDSVDLIDEVMPEVCFDALGHDQIWADMIRLQRQGVYPEAFRKISCPAVMLHGAEDPHPGRMIYENLRQYIHQLEYLEFARCGHYPWLEMAAREEFYTVLKRWLIENSGL